MKKQKSIVLRLALLTHGRKPFLEFIRNLPVQAGLLAVCLFCISRVVETGIANSPNALLVAMLFALALGIAIYANATTFYEQCFSELEEGRQQHVARLVGLGVSRLRRGFTMMGLFVRERWVEALEVTFTMLLIQTSLMWLVFQAVMIFNGYSSLVHSQRREPTIEKRVSDARSSPAHLDKQFVDINSHPITS